MRQRNRSGDLRLFADFVEEAVVALEHVGGAFAGELGEGAGLRAERALQEHGFLQHRQEVVADALGKRRFVELVFANCCFEVDQDALERR